MKLSNIFLQKMKILLKDEFDAFLAGYEKPVFRGIRLNTLKCDEAVLRQSLPFAIEKAPFSETSYYVPAEMKAGLLPAHHAGMFYAQEPSAASAVTVLDPQPGETVLDLCAAPGGKSTQIAAKLRGQGLIWSNEIVLKRANSLLSNIERLGVMNGVVSSCKPDVICEKLQGFFDRVLVDAPCSGEGMFRKDEEARAQWSEELVSSCAERQLSILNAAAKAVKIDGVLVYSTCTFSEEENEETVKAFLRENPGFKLVPIDMPFGRKAFDMAALRIFPMDGGEGHFVAKFRRIAENCKAAGSFITKSIPEEKEGRELLELLFRHTPPSKIARFGDRLHLLPEGLPVLEGLHILRAGCPFAEVKKSRSGQRLEPHHAVFMAQTANNCRNSIDFEPDDADLLRFLKGGEINCMQQGYTAVSVNGVVTGFGKASGGRLKNRYPKGLRML